jgi:hypothetical protein
MNVKIKKIEKLDLPLKLYNYNKTIGINVRWIQNGKDVISREDSLKNNECKVTTAGKTIKEFSNFFQIFRNFKKDDFFVDIWSSLCFGEKKEYQGEINKRYNAGGFIDFENNYIGKNEYSNNYENFFEQLKKDGFFIDKNKDKYNVIIYYTPLFIDGDIKIKEPSIIEYHNGYIEYVAKLSFFFYKLNNK